MDRKKLKTIETLEVSFISFQKQFKNDLGNTGVQEEKKGASDNNAVLNVI